MRTDHAASSQQQSSLSALCHCCGADSAQFLCHIGVGILYFCTAYVDYYLSARSSRSCTHHCDDVDCEQRTLLLFGSVAVLHSHTRRSKSYSYPSNNEPRDTSDGESRRGNPDIKTTLFLPSALHVRDCLTS
jgi:hypothetical protein